MLTTKITKLALLAVMFTAAANLEAAKPTPFSVVSMTLHDQALAGAAKSRCSIAVPGCRGPNGLTVAGNVVFCAGGQTVAAYDIRDPKHPPVLASQSFPKYRKDKPMNHPAFLFGLIGALSLSIPSSQSANRPNIILCMADDPGCTNGKVR